MGPEGRTGSNTRIKYRHRRDAVYLEDRGISVREARGRMLIPWEAVEAVRAVPVPGAERRQIRVVLVGGSVHLLPAPLERPGGDDARFEEALDRMTGQYLLSRAVDPDDPQDQVPSEFLIERARAVEFRGRGGPWRGGFFFALLAVVGVWCLTVVVMASTPDYGTPGLCTAYESAQGAGPQHWCDVTGATVYAVGLDDDGVASIVVGSPPSIQTATFSGPQPRLKGIEPGDMVAYRAANGGKIAQIDWHGSAVDTIDPYTAAGRKEINITALIVTAALTGLCVLAAAWQRVRLWRIRRGPA